MHALLCPTEHLAHLEAVFSFELLIKRALQQTVYFLVKDCSSGHQIQATGQRAGNHFFHSFKYYHGEHSMRERIKESDPFETGLPNCGWCRDKLVLS